MSLKDDLRAPFPYKDIEWRVQRSGDKNGKLWAMVLAYVDARAVMNRLDEVFGIDGWQDDYVQWDGGVICHLKVFTVIETSPTTTDTKWITKTDGSPETAVEAFKGGLSKALVRTAVKYGIGRYLYYLKTTFAVCEYDKPEDITGWTFAKFDGKPGWWQTPPEESFPKWALPKAK